MTPELTAAVARLRADANKYPWLLHSHDIIAILAALAAAQADAERYRWLRAADTPVPAVEYPDGNGFYYLSGEALDAAIDAHLKGKP